MGLASLSICGLAEGLDTSSECTKQDIFVAAEFCFISGQSNRNNAESPHAQEAGVQKHQTPSETVVIVMHASLIRLAAGLQSPTRITKYGNFPTTFLVESHEYACYISVSLPKEVVFILTGRFR